MTGRELLAALRPVEQHAKAVLRFAEVAQEAIRLEAGLELASKKLAETTGALQVAHMDLARVQGDARGLAETLVAERAAAEHETAERCAERVAEAEGAVAKQQAAAEAWAEKTRAAEATHVSRLAQWTAEEAALREHVDGLRALAQRMAKAAEAVPR